MGCIDKLFNQSPEIHNYLRKQAGIDYDPKTGEGKQEWIKAAKELQDHSLRTLNDVYAKVGVPGFEKSTTKEVNPLIQTAIDNAGDAKAKIYQNVLKSGNEQDISDVLKEVSDQWHDEGTRAQTERDFGKPIVDAAKEMFPQKSEKSLNTENIQNEKNNTTDGRSAGETNQSSSGNIQKPAKEKGIFERAKAIEPIDPYDRVLKYFSDGGKIDNSVVQSLFGNNRKSTEEQRKSMIGFLKKGGNTIDQLAHSLWESDQTENHTTQDYKEAIEAALNEHGSPAAMAKELVSRNDPDEALKKFLNDRYGEDIGSKENVLDAVNIVEGMSVEEINHLLELDANTNKQNELNDYVNGLHEKFNSENKPTGKQAEAAQPNNAATSETSQAAEKTVDEGGAPKKKSQPIKEDGNKKTVGVSHEALKKLAARIGLAEPERGEVLTPKEYVERGRELLKAGADPAKVAADFKEDGKISVDELSVARAHYENLVKAAQDAYDNYGESSNQYKEAKEAADKWQQEVVKPMGTAGGKFFRGLQGETDLDTGSFVSMQRLFEDYNGKGMTDKQKKEAKELSGKVKVLSEKVKSLEKKLSDALDKMEVDDNKPENIKEKAKRIADKIRKGKLSRPDVFSSATPASLLWDGALEASAKTIEGLGTVAQAIADGIAHIKASDWYKGLNKDKQEEAEKGFKDFFNDRIKNEDLFTRFVDKSDNKFTPEEAKSIWEYAKKEYLDEGKTYYQMIAGVSTDLGIKPEQVRYALEQPKGARVITDEMYRAQSERNKAIKSAKIWVQSANTPRIVKLLKAVPSFFFEKAIFGHGTVGMVTHAGMNLFRPSGWKSYFTNFIRQFKNAFGSTADYEKRMENLKLRPNFILGKRSGLANDPESIYDDYGGLKKFFGRLGVAGDRGFNALKEYRQDLFDAIYNNASKAEKSDPEYPKTIATMVNHATGTSKVPVPETVGTLIFAPRLEASRWARLLVQPAKAVTALTHWNTATPSEKAAAKLVAKRTGEIIGTYAALLAANQAVLTLTGSKQKINFTNPADSDWLKFKIGGSTIDASGGMISAINFLGKLVQVTRGDKRELKGDTRSKASMSLFGKYIRGKASPFAATAYDFYTHHDFAGNTLPGFKDKPDNRFAHKMTWAEYLTQRQTPIPVAEAFTDVAQQMKDKGMSKVEISNILHGILVGVISGGTGTRVLEDYKIKEHQK